MQPYVTYDILKEGWSLTYLEAPLGVMALTAVFGFLYWRSQKTPKPFPRGPAIVACFVLVCGYFACANVFYQRHKCLQWARAGDYQTVEGTVENYDPEPAGGHANESFYVNGTHFSCSSYDLTRGGFEQTAGSHSPIRPGVRVKIYHHEKRILKIEVFPAPPVDQVSK